MTEYNIRLNPNCASVVHTGLKFKKGDKGITFKIAVDEIDTAGTTAKIVFLRANGTSVESNIFGTDGVYTYKTLGNEFAVPGKTVADVKIYLSGNRESTASFLFDVCGDTMDGLGAGTGGYSDRLEQLVKEAEEAGELTEQAKAELEAAESDMEDMKAEMETVLQNFKEQYSEVGALNPRGTWTTGIKYQIRDVVYHNSSSWISLVDNNTVEPTNANKTHWMRSTDLQSILNGTTPVGDSKKLNGLTATEVGASGARNLIPYPSASFTTTTVNGVTVTYTDGTFTLNGTATSNAYIHVWNPKSSIRVGTYAFSIEQGTKGVNVGVDKIDANSAYLGRYATGGTSATFDYPSEDIDTYYPRFWIMCTPGTPYDNVTVSPMLELGSVAHDYVPYHFGGAEDSLTLQGMDISEFVTNENLLVNPDFAINTNGTDATGWDLIRASLTRNEDGSITLTRTGATTQSAYIRRRIPSGTRIFNGKTVTASFEDTNGERYSFTFTAGAGVSSRSFGDIQILYDATQSTFNGDAQIAFGLVLNSTAQTLGIKWAKLEIGKQATPFVPPNPLIEAVKCGVADADTVDGWHIYSSLSELGLEEATATAETIVNAMADKSILLHKLSGTATSATLQFPYNYSMLKVTKMSVSYVSFECIGTGNLPIYHAYYNGGVTTKWSGWSTQFLPLTGGTANGSIILDKGTNFVGFQSRRTDSEGKVHIAQYWAGAGNALMALYAIGEDGKQSEVSTLTLYKDRLTVRLNGTTHTVHHDGNSAKVVQATSAPSDTTAVWVDTANKVTKIYKDGAWTALA